jgi:hypothetical protein
MYAPLGSRAYRNLLAARGLRLLPHRPCIRSSNPFLNSDVPRHHPRPSRFAQGFDEIMAIGLIKEDGFTTISPAQDMIDRAGVLSANGTCYPSILPQRTPGGKCKNGQIYGLTPAPLLGLTPATPARPVYGLTPADPCFGQIYGLTPAPCSLGLTPARFPLLPLRALYGGFYG